jgi:hypothetical protein
MSWVAMREIRRAVRRANAIAAPSESLISIAVMAAAATTDDDRKAKCENHQQSLHRKSSWDSSREVIGNVWSRQSRFSHTDSLAGSLVTLVKASTDSPTSRLALGRFGRQVHAANGSLPDAAPTGAIRAELPVFIIQCHGPLHNHPRRVRRASAGGRGWWTPTTECDVPQQKHGSHSEKQDTSRIDDQRNPP